MGWESSQNAPPTSVDPEVSHRDQLIMNLLNGTRIEKILGSRGSFGYWKRTRSVRPTEAARMQLATDVLLRPVVEIGACL
jgi:hypothetical protein